MDDNSSDSVSSGGGDNVEPPPMPNSPLTDAQVPPAAPPSPPSIEPEPSIPQIEEKKEEFLPPPPPELPKDELPKPNLAKSAVLAAVFLLIAVSSVAGYFLVRKGGLGVQKKAVDQGHYTCSPRAAEDVGSPRGYDNNPSNGTHSWGHFGFSCRPQDFHCGNPNKSKTYLMTVIKCANDDPGLCGHGQGTVILNSCSLLSVDNVGKGDIWWDYIFRDLGWQCGRYQFDICPGETCPNPDFSYQFTIPCPSPTATPIPSPTVTNTPTPTGTVIPSLTPTGTVVPTQTLTPIPTDTPRPTATATPTTPPGVPTPTPQPTIAPACNFVKVYKVNSDGTKTQINSGAFLMAGDRLYLEASFKLNTAVQKAVVAIRKDGVVVREKFAQFISDPPTDYDTDYRITFYYDITATGNYEVGAFYYYHGAWH